MPNRDYAARSKSKKSSNKLLIAIIILLLLLLSGLGLWVLNQAGSNSANQPAAVKVQEQPKAQLPTRPEETYSYIRELETREVPVDKNSKMAKLSAEQEKQIRLQKEAEKQRLAQQEQLTQQAAQSETAQAGNEPDAVITEPELTPEQLAEKKAQEQKAAEERRKQAELKKQQELAKKAEQEKKKAELEKQKVAEQQKAQQQKSQPVKIVATAKPASEAPKSQGKYGLQCGAFKSKAQAENMQARLAMAGYNARINASADWNRVVVGPVGDRAAASAAQSNARSVAECLIVGM